MKSESDWLDLMIQRKPILEIQPSQRMEYIKRIPPLLNITMPNSKGMEVIHVTGTNGKTSFCIALSEQAMRNGKQVVTCVSPHLITPHERVLINGKNFDDEVFWSWYEQVQPILYQDGVGFKEQFLGFVELMLYFGLYCAQAADVLILEAGIGGLYDNTNILETHDLAVITSVDLDHMAILGNTRSEIAFQKLGICRSEKPLLLGTRHPEIQEVLESQVTSLDLPLYYPKSLRDLPANDPSLHHLMGTTDEMIECAVEILGWQYDSNTLPIMGRRQWIIYDGVNILFDNAHNEMALARLNSFIGAQKNVILAGSLIDQREVSYQHFLFQNTIHAVFTRIPHPFRPSQEFHPSISSNVDISWHDNYQHAFSQSLKKAKEENAILIITGSTFLVGSILSSVNKDR